MLVIQSDVVVIQVALPLECIPRRQRVCELKVRIGPRNMMRQTGFQIGVRAADVTHLKLIPFGGPQSIDSRRIRLQIHLDAAFIKSKGPE